MGRPNTRKIRPLPAWANFEAVGVRGRCPRSHPKPDLGTPGSSPLKRAHPTGTYLSLSSASLANIGPIGLVDLQVTLIITTKLHGPVVRFRVWNTSSFVILTADYINAAVFCTIVPTVVAGSYARDEPAGAREGWSSCCLDRSSAACPTAPGGK